MSTTERTDTEPTVPEILRAARKGAGLTQRQLAARLGVSQQAITGWETGERHPSGEDTFRFLRACGVKTTLRQVGGVTPIRYKASTTRPPMGVTTLPPVTAATDLLAAA